MLRNSSAAASYFEIPPCSTAPLLPFPPCHSVGDDAFLCAVTKKGRKKLVSRFRATGRLNLRSNRRNIDMLRLHGHVVHDVSHTSSPRPPPRTSGHLIHQICRQKFLIFGCSGFHLPKKDPFRAETHPSAHPRSKRKPPGLLGFAGHGKEGTMGRGGEEQLIGRNLMLHATTYFEMVQ